MTNKIFFKKIKFTNLKEVNFSKIIKKKGYFVFPAAPNLVTLDYEKNYYKSLLNADYVFFDSGFFVILLKLFKNISVTRFSGFKFLKLFFNFLKKNNYKIILSVDPSNQSAKLNKRYFKKIGIKKIFNYVAKNYDVESIKDKQLLNKIKKIKPNYVVINIGGGKQEILASYLSKSLKKNNTIICTGAAISFFTGETEPVNNFADKFFLGWFIRLIFNPKIFLKRYLVSLNLIPIVFKSKVYKK